MNVVIRDLKHDSSVIFYFDALMYAREHGGVREEGYFLELSLKQLEKALGRSTAQVQHSLRKLQEIGVIERTGEWTLPLKTRGLIFKKEIYEDWSLDEMKTIEKFTNEEKIFINGAVGNTSNKSLSRDEYIASLRMSRDNSTEGYIIDTIDGLIRKLKLMSASEWSELKAMVPFDVDVAE